MLVHLILLCHQLLSLIFLYYLAEFTFIYIPRRKMEQIGLNTLLFGAQNVMNSYMGFGKENMKDSPRENTSNQSTDRSDKTDKDSLTNAASTLRQKWSTTEDNLLNELVKLHGTNYWPSIAQLLPGRNGKQCRERWMYHLNPDIKKGSWSEEEDHTIVEMHKVLGTQWAKIAKVLPGRSDGNVKNRFYALERIRLRNSSPDIGDSSNEGYNVISDDPLSQLAQLASAAMFMPAMKDISRSEEKQTYKRLLDSDVNPLKKKSRKSEPIKLNSLSLFPSSSVSDKFNSSFSSGKGNTSDISKLNLNQLPLMNMPSEGRLSQLPEVNNFSNTHAVWKPLNTANTLNISASLNQIDHPFHVAKSRHSLPSLSASMSSPIPSSVVLPPLFVCDMRSIGNSIFRCSLDSISQLANRTNDVISQLVKPPSASFMLDGPTS